MHILYVNFLHWSITGGGTRLPRELAVRMSGSHAVSFASHLESYEKDWLSGTATTLDAPARDRTWSEQGVTVHLVTFGPAARRLAFPIMLNSRLFALRGAGFRFGLGRKMGRLMKQADVVHAFPMGKGLFARCAFREARGRGIPFLITPCSHQTAAVSNEIILELTRRADGVVALTSSEREALVGQGVSPSRIRVIGFGPLLHPRPIRGFLRRSVGPNKRIVLFLGRKTRYKGAGLLLEASQRVFEKCPDAVFVFAGPDTDVSREMFRTARDPRIIVLPELTEEEKAGAFCDCDVFCMPSAEESLGGVYIEAWSQGKPVVALDIPPVRELMRDGANGFTVRDDPDELARKLVVTLSDPVLAATMGRNGRLMVEQEFSWDGVTARTEAFYREILAGKRRG